MHKIRALILCGALLYCLTFSVSENLHFCFPGVRNNLNKSVVEELNYNLFFKGIFEPVRGVLLGSGKF